MTEKVLHISPRRWGKTAPSDHYYHVQNISSWPGLGASPGKVEGARQQDLWSSQLHDCPGELTCSSSCTAWRLEKHLGCLNRWRLQIQVASDFGNRSDLKSLRFQLQFFLALPSNRFRGDSAAILWSALRFQIVQFYCDLKSLRLQFCDLGHPRKAHLRPHSKPHKHVGTRIRTHLSSWRFYWFPCCMHTLRMRAHCAPQLA